VGQVERDSVSPEERRSDVRSREQVDDVNGRSLPRPTRNAELAGQTGGANLELVRRSSSSAEDTWHVEKR
jgi:hypothetical protein